MDSNRNTMFFNRCSCPEFLYFISSTYSPGQSYLGHFTFSSSVLTCLCGALSPPNQCCCNVLLVSAKFKKTNDIRIEDSLDAF